VGFLACFATQVAALLKGLVEHTAGQQQQQQCHNACLQQDIHSRCAGCAAFC
jgi:hypothetical protein